MDKQHRAFLSGERPEDVLIYLSDTVLSDSDALAEHGSRVDGGTVLVLPGDRGRSVFEQIVDVPTMSFASTAMETEGTVADDCTGGECPSTGSPPEDHQVRVLLAFAEEQNEEVGGLYGAGDVIHAYAGCTCDTTYSDRWVIGESDGS